MTSPVAILVNPFSGRGRGARVAEVAVAELASRGVEVCRFDGESALSTPAMIRDALATAPRAIIVVGGDGTISGVVNAIDHVLVEGEQAPPIVVVPAGTGNDLARALGIPLNDPATAALAAVDGRLTHIDSGTVQSGEHISRFLTVVALGFDALVSARTNRLRWPSGPLRYYLALAVELIRLAPIHYQIAVDGNSSVKRLGTIAAIGNTRGYGGGMPVCPDASPHDGLLDFVTVAPLGRLRLLHLFPLLLKGTHVGRPEVTTTRVRVVRVSAPGLIAYADGEQVGLDEVEVTVHPESVPMLLPAGAPLP